MKIILSTLALMISYAALMILRPSVWTVAASCVWWVCLLWWANWINVKIIRYAYRKKALAP